MNTQRAAHGIVMEVTFWLIFITDTTTCVPVRTFDDILKSEGNEGSLLSGDVESIAEFTRKIWSPHIIENGIPADLDHTSRNSRLYLVLDDQEGIEETNTTVTPDSGNKREVDPWSLLFYMASFGGFVAFFLVISCFECCCCKCASRRPQNTSTDSPVEPLPTETQWVHETPPPPYHLFAPPSYDTLFYGSVRDDKHKCGVYVVPIHNDIGTPYSTARSVPTEPT
ncbi:uncharacterized protein LOC111866290 [Cryptotermes secundus]|uniref:uncharacterized protein LOC111866290 n=1 Tax=Cryptotermes secundus TaxID=105785 RepID=UPI000CD7CCEC|nr:uncharacterized protein LOC111866290 [Cryptotermes secundus]